MRLLIVAILIYLVSPPDLDAQVFPGVVATDRNLYVAVGGVSTTISAAVTAASTTFPVGSVANMQPFELLVIDNEIVLECAFTQSPLAITIGKNTCPGTDGRGMGGTAAASHANGARIADFITGEHHNASRKEIEAIEAALGSNLSNIPGTANGPATPISKGGTGATTQPGALANILGINPLPTAGLCFTNAANPATCITPGVAGTVLTSTGPTTTPSWGAGGSGGVSSVFGRMGTVAAQAGDYAAAQVTNAVDQSQMYADPAWITSLAWAKITGTPNFAINPMITAGDVIVGGAGGAPVRLAVPGTGTFCPNWTAAGAVGWVPCPGGGGASGITSIGLTMPSAFNVTGSPLTANGVITVAAAGNATQYINGLGQLATLPTSVSSVFGRTGTVVAVAGDYTTSLVTEGTNLYYTNARVYAAITATTPIVFSSTTGVISCPTCGTGSGGVTSVFGRVGAVVAATGDYNANQVTNAENVQNKDVNGGYVGRDATGNATIPSVWTGARFTSSDTTHTSVVSMIPGISGNFPFTVPTGQYSLFLDSSNGNKLTRRDSNGVNTVIEGAVGNVAGAPYTQTFTSQTTVALAHNLNLTNLTAFNIACFDTTNTLINPSTVTATNANTVTVTFAVATSGSCTITTGGTGGGTGGASFSYFAYTGSAALAFGAYNAVLVTASGGNPTLTVSTNPATAGTPIWVGLCNDTTSRTWILPANFHQIPAPLDASQCVYTAAIWNGTNYQGIGGDSTPFLIQGPERAAPTTSVTGFSSLWPDSTRHTWASLSNASVNQHIMPRCAGTTDQCASTDLSDTANIALLSGAQSFTGVKTFTASPVMLAPTLSNVTGATAQCLHVSTTGLISGTGVDCGTGTGGGASFGYNAYTGSAAIAFGTYNSVLVTASGANPALTVSTNPTSAGTPIWIGLCNDTTSRTWTLPSSFQQISTPIDPSQCAYTAATWNGTNYQGTGGNSTPLLIQGPERVAPGTPAASFTSIWPDSTRHTWTSFSNGSTNQHIMPRCAGTTDQCALGDLSNGTAAGVVSLFTSCSGTQYLGADGACHTVTSGSPSVGAVNHIQTSNGSGTFLDGGCTMVSSALSCPATALPSTAVTVPTFRVDATTGNMELTRVGSNVADFVGVSPLSGPSSTPGGPTAFMTYISANGSQFQQALQPIDLPVQASTTSTSSPGAETSPFPNSAYFYNNATGAITFTLPSSALAGTRRCYQNSTGRTGVITVAVPSGAQIDLAGANGTSSTGTLVSGGALGDSVCLITDTTNHWMAIVQRGTWTNH